MSSWNYYYFLFFQQRSSIYNHKNYYYFLYNKYMANYLVNSFYLYKEWNAYQLSFGFDAFASYHWIINRLYSIFGAGRQYLYPQINRSVKSQPKYMYALRCVSFKRNFFYKPWILNEDSDLCCTLICLLWA